MRILQLIMGREFDEARSSGSAEVLTSAMALKKHGLTPVRLGPKEGLGLINGALRPLQLLSTS